MPDAERHAAGAGRRVYCAKRDSQPAPKAVERLTAEGARFVTFDRFPRDHGCHRRTTHPVESPFAAVPRRPTAAKGLKQVDSATGIVWNVLRVVDQTCRRLTATA